MQELDKHKPFHLAITNTFVSSMVRTNSTIYVQTVREYGDLSLEVVNRLGRPVGVKHVMDANMIWMPT